MHLTHVTMKTIYQQYHELKYGNRHSKNNVFKDNYFDDSEILKKELNYFKTSLLKVSNTNLKKRTQD